MHDRGSLTWWEILIINLLLLLLSKLAWPEAFGDLGSISLYQVIDYLRLKLAIEVLLKLLRAQNLRLLTWENPLNQPWNILVDIECYFALWDGPSTCLTHFWFLHAYDTLLICLFDLLHLWKDISLGLLQSEILNFFALSMICSTLVLSAQIVVLDR